ncbi:MAG TPA: bifunctional UDP-N-acetylglucosamine diphosphorylase/glucosamine-1-phosphate N-acetyltransferase GlmU [Xanthomonadales bacterium]|nr:bifunctional UDP-N-acetylglucosamine diphosphorylase/glucosamine-1-phosphate N-acetyltransferase GlmU [Xanthomonadales bacterium]
MSEGLHIIILAAGEGTRMQSNLPKVLHPVGGKPMLVHLLQTAGELQPDAIHVVIGSGAEQVREACAGISSNWPVNFVVQEERRGTGHATDQAMPGVPDEAHVLVLLGDHPLITSPVLQQMLVQPLPALAVLTMLLDDPKGYGRIERDRTGRVNGIVEERDATPAQRAIHEVNTGIILAQAGVLRHWLQQLECSNSKNEYYLTDIFAMAYKQGYEIRAVQAPDPRDLQGANDRRQVAALEHRYRQRRADELMANGVNVLDPARIDVRGEITVGRDVVIDINVVLEGEIELGDGVLIGPGSVLKDCRLAAGTVVKAYSVLEGVQTTGACEIGPFARLRPGTELSAGSRIGNFVEVKNSRLGENSKANHLSYVGDSQVGDRVNIGAGTITCNYDGANKHETVIEDDVFIGSDTQLVAPVTIGKGATIGAGSTITKDTPAGELTLSRTRQFTPKGWQRPVKNDPQKKDS